MMWKKETQKYGSPYPYLPNVTGKDLNLSTRESLTAPSFGVAGMQLKLVLSETGPGEELAKALYHTGNYLFIGISTYSKLNRVNAKPIKYCQ